MIAAAVFAYPAAAFFPRRFSSAVMIRGDDLPADLRAATCAISPRILPKLDDTAR